MNQYAILVENEISEWDDLTGVKYHFPKNRYLNRLATGMKIIYYKGRTKNNPPQYFGYGEIGNIYPASSDKKTYYADINNYIEFEQPLNFKLNGEYLEEITKSNPFRQNSVRTISAERFVKILELAKLNIVTDVSSKEPIAVTPLPLLEDVSISLSDKTLIKTKLPKVKNKVNDISSIYGSKNAKKYGDRGEYLVLKYLRSILSKSEVETLRHNAAEKEKDGYDISYIDSQGQKIYIEVKSTSADSFPSFILTINELMAAEAYGNAYKLFLVNKVTSTNASIEIIENVASLLADGLFSKSPLTFKIEKNIM